MTRHRAVEVVLAALVLMGALVPVAEDASGAVDRGGEGFERVAGPAPIRPVGTAPDRASPVTETVWQRNVPPGTEWDRIGLHRYRNASVPTRAAVLYLPGTNQSGVSHSNDESVNLWVYLANRGIEVFALDYRTHFVAPDHAGDLAFMATWTLERFVADAELGRAHIALVTPGKPVFVAGFSRGVSIAYGLANVSTELAGLIALDGSFKSHAMGGFDRQSAMDKLVATGRYASRLARRGWQARHDLMARTYENPGGPAIKEKYDTIGDELTTTLQFAWGDGRLANPAAGTSDIAVLAQLLDTYDWFYPNVQNVDGRAIASRADDPATRLDDRWGKMRLPIIYFGTSGFGADALMAGIYSASKSGSRDVTLNVLEGYGHLDALVAKDAPRDVYQVIVDWVGERLK
jgi:hypothetical protein